MLRRVLSLAPWSAAGLLSCGPVVEQATQSQLLRSGETVVVERSQPTVLDETEEKAWVVRYRSRWMDDRERLEQEVADVWETLRGAVERKQLALALIQPHDRRWEGWDLRGRETQFVFRRDEEGWSMSEEPELKSR